MNIFYNGIFYFKKSGIDTDNGKKSGDDETQKIKEFAMRLPDQRKEFPADK